jgi:hypothetical protein
VSVSTGAGPIQARGLVDRGRNLAHHAQGFRFLNDILVALLD